MKPCVSIRKGKAPVVMEVIGEDGLKVGEYVDGKSKKRPYYVLEESHAI